MERIGFERKGKSGTKKKRVGGNTLQKARRDGKVAGGGDSRGGWKKSLWSRR